MNRTKLIQQAFVEGFIEKCSSLSSDMAEGFGLGAVGGSLGGAGLEGFKQVLDDRHPDLNFKKILRTGIGSGLGGAAGGLVGGGLTHLLGHDSRVIDDISLRLPIILGAITGARMTRDKKDKDTSPLGNL